MKLSAAVQACESLKGTFVRRHTSSSLREFMAPLLAEYTMFGIGRSAHQTWWRARKVGGDRRFENLKQLIYPPASETRWNRANSPEQPTLYASWNVATALDEIAARSNERIQLIGLRVRNPIDLPCALIGEFQSIHNSGGSLINARNLEQQISQLLLASDPERIQLQLFLDSFFSELFRGQPKRSEDYLPSVIFAEHLLSRAQGLMFPSVETAHAINLAVRAPVFNKAFEVICTFVLEVGHCFGYGVYEARLTDNSVDFLDDGTIQWQSHRTLPSFFAYQTGFLFPVESRGWRVPVDA